MFGQFGNWRRSLNNNIYENKSSEELWCVKVKLLHILKSNVFQKTSFIWFTKCIYYVFGYKKHFLLLKIANKRALNTSVQQHHKMINFRSQKEIHISLIRFMQFLISTNKKIIWRGVSFVGVIFTCAYNIKSNITNTDYFTIFL